MSDTETHLLIEKQQKPSPPDGAVDLYKSPCRQCHYNRDSTKTTVCNCGPIIAGVLLFVYCVGSCIYLSGAPNCQDESRVYVIYSAATAGAVVISQLVGVGICYWLVKVVMHPNIVTFGMGLGAIVAAVIGIIVVCVAICVVVGIIWGLGEILIFVGKALVNGKCIKINKTVTIV